MTGKHTIIHEIKTVYINVDDLTLTCYVHVHDISYGIRKHAA